MIRMYYLASPLGIHRSIIGNDSKQARIHNERYPTHQSMILYDAKICFSLYNVQCTYNFQLVHELITFSHFCKSQINVKALKIESVPKLSSHWIGVPLQNAILLQSGFIYWTQQKSEAELKPVKSSHRNHLLDLWHRTFKFAFLAGYRFGSFTFFFADGYIRPKNTFKHCFIIVYQTIFGQILGWWMLSWSKGIFYEDKGRDKWQLQKPSGLVKNVLHASVRVLNERRIWRQGHAESSVRHVDIIYHDNYVLHSSYATKVKKVENKILRCQMKNSK